jgi:hypothetical protein
MNELKRNSKDDVFARAENFFGVSFFDVKPSIWFYFFVTANIAVVAALAFFILEKPVAGITIGILSLFVNLVLSWILIDADAGGFTTDIYDWNTINLLDHKKNPQVLIMIITTEFVRFISFFTPLGILFYNFAVLAISESITVWDDSDIVGDIVNQEKKGNTFFVKVEWDDEKVRSSHLYYKQDNPFPVKSIKVNPHYYANSLKNSTSAEQWFRERFKLSSRIVKETIYISKADAVLIQQLEEYINQVESDWSEIKEANIFTLKVEDGERAKLVDNYFSAIKQLKETKNQLPELEKEIAEKSAWIKEYDEYVKRCKEEEAAITEIDWVKFGIEEFRKDIAYLASAKDDAKPETNDSEENKPVHEGVF